MPVIKNVGVNKNGILYNSYLLSDSKSVLIDTVPKEYGEELINNIKTELAGKTLDYIIMNHTEQDRSGAFYEVIKEYPDAVVMASVAGLKNLGVQAEFDERAAKSNQTLQIGENCTLRFLITHNINWPDSIMTYFEEEKVLFSCDAFSDEGKGLKCYYDEKLSYLSSYVYQAMLMLRSLEIKAIYPGSGAEADKTAVENYLTWSKEIKSDNKKFAVIYDTTAGNTEKAARIIVDVLNGLNADNVLISAKDADTEYILKTIYECDGILLGSPTVYRNLTDKMRKIITSLNHYKTAGRKFGAFGSYGWSGEGANLIYSYLRARHFETFKAPIRFIFSPAENEIEQLTSFTEEFYDAVIKE